MKIQHIFVVLLFAVILLAGPASAADFTIVNGDSAGEGLNDLTPVTPVGGNTGTTLGEQRMNVLQAAADQWGTLIESSVEIRILARFNTITCGVLGSTGPGSVYRNFPGAPVPGVWFHSATTDSITGVDQNPVGTDFNIQYNSGWDGVTCPSSFYYGLDGNEPAGTEDLFPVVLHEMGHGLGFASLVNSATGVQWSGAPDIFGYYTLDMTSGLHWSEMTTNAQRQASAINYQNVVWDGPNATPAAFEAVQIGPMELEVTAPPAIVGTYDAHGANFGDKSQDEFSGEFELVNAVSGTPSFGCDTLSGFTPGRIAVIDRGTCEFGLKALNAENAGASGVIMVNNEAGNILINMGAGADGDQVTIPLAAIGQDDGNTIKAQLPGVNATVRVLQRYGLHASRYPLLYTPNPVQPGSSVSHWEDYALPDLLMEPFTSETIAFDATDITPAQLKDVGHTVVGFDEIFDDGFETGGTTAWTSTTP